MIEYVAVRHVLWRRGSGDVGVGLTEDAALLEPCRRRAEDEVGSALDVAVAEVETRLGIARIDGVLMAQKTTIDEGQTVALSMQGHSLSKACRIILDGDVLERDTAALDFQGKGAERAYFLCFATGCQRCDVCLDIGMVVPRDDGLVAILTAYLDVGEPLWDDEFLLIDTLLDVDDLVVLHKGTAHLDGFADVAELARTVACHEKRIRVIIAFSLGKSNIKIQ